MSIETTGLAKADTFQATAATPAGFVKNDASGNLLLGEPGSAWTLHQAFDFTSDINSAGGGTAVNFTGLNGDVDEVYLLLCRFVFPGTTGVNMNLAPNGVLTSVDYAASALLQRADGSRVSFNANGTTMPICQSNNGHPDTTHCIRLHFHAKSGVHRTWEAQEQTAPVVSSNSYHFGFTRQGGWRDTVTNVTSLALITNAGGTPTILGSVANPASFYLYKLDN